MLMGNVTFAGILLIVIDGAQGGEVELCDWEGIGNEGWRCKGKMRGKNMSYKDVIMKCQWREGILTRIGIEGGEVMWDVYDKYIVMRSLCFMEAWGDAIDNGSMKYYWCRGDDGEDCVRRIVIVEQTSPIHLLCMYYRIGYPKIRKRRQRISSPLLVQGMNLFLILFILFVMWYWFIVQWESCTGNIKAVWLELRNCWYVFLCLKCYLVIFLSIYFLFYEADVKYSIFYMNVSKWYLVMTK